MTRVTRKNSGSFTYEFEQLQPIPNYIIFDVVHSYETAATASQMSSL